MPKIDAQDAQDPSHPQDPPYCKDSRDAQDARYANPSGITVSMPVPPSGGTGK